MHTMTRLFPATLALSTMLISACAAQTPGLTPLPMVPGGMTPNEIVAEAPDGDWRAIPADDLLVMDLAPAPDRSARRIVIQLTPAPLSTGWTDNIRTLARAEWWDGTTVYRVVENWVAQWGDGEDDTAVAKPLPAGLREVPEAEYTAALPRDGATIEFAGMDDPYADHVGYRGGLPVAWNDREIWPIHCYGAVGVARDLTPDTGTGAELYVVIGHAPRPLDRNIAVVGRMIEGIEHLSTLPRGKGGAGVYDDDSLKVPIRSVRLASDLPAGDRVAYEYLDPASPSFARYISVWQNRSDSFYQVAAGGVDVCNARVPVRAAD